MDTSKHWSFPHYIYYCIILLLGIVARFYEFDLRPLHHDESLHGLYSLYYFQDSVNGYYRYNPLLHGPLLYHSLPWSYWLFGVSKFAVRIPSVVLGSSLLLLPLVFKNKLSKYSILLATTVIALSPTMVYWSRFIRHDNFIFAAILLLLFALFKTHGVVKYLLIALSFALQFSCKENTFIHVTFIFAFLFYEHIILTLARLNMSTTASQIFSSIKSHKVATLLAAALFILVFMHFYSAGFVYMEGFLDGAYRKSLLYWFDQHQKERISGPFSYTFMINSFFESWWLPALLAHIFYFYKSRENRIRLIFLSSLVVALILHFTLGSPINHIFTAKVLKLKIPLDYYLFFPIIIHSLVLTTVYLLEEKRELAISGFIFFASLFTYSYLGEKVPWLALYPLISGIVFFAFFFDKLFQKPVLLIILPLLLLNVSNLVWTNYTHSSHPTNLLSQVHTSAKFENMMHRTREEMKEKSPLKYLLVYQSYTWPTTWYMHGAKGYHFKEQGKKIESYQYVLAKPEDGRINQKLVRSHDKQTIPLRSWWLPRYKELSFTNFWNYYIKKKTWNESGGNQVSLWTKKKP